jgi:hypothetical protein
MLLQQESADLRLLDGSLLGLEPLSPLLPYGRDPPGCQRKEDEQPYETANRLARQWSTYREHSATFLPEMALWQLGAKTKGNRCVLLPSRMLVSMEWRFATVSLPY